jgi:branched-chain amino acid transport system permease protein
MALPKIVPKLAPVLASAIALSGCAIVDAGQARTCRSILPALNPSASGIEIVRTAPLPGGEGVRIDYRAPAPTGLLRARFVECRFGPGGPLAPEQQTLVGVNTDAGRLGELRVHVLRRFWLEREGPAADPEPAGNAASVPILPRGLAIGLQHALFALPPIAVYALLAAAYSLIYGLVGRINFAFGELAAVGGYAAFLGFALAGAAPAATVTLMLAAALVLALSSAFAHGIAASRLVFAPLLRLTGQQLLIGTVALAIVLQEYLRLAQGPRQLWLRPVLSTPYAVARAGDFVVTVTPIAVGCVALCLVAALALLVLMRRSRFGRTWRACADDLSAAALLGIDGRRVLVQTFALASALAGLAGYVVTVYWGMLGYAGGFALGLKSLLAAVAGGIGSVPGAFLGAILLGLAEALWSALLPIAFRDIAVLALLVILLVLRPGGLMGVRDPPPKV